MGSGSDTYGECTFTANTGSCIGDVCNGAGACSYNTGGSCRASAGTCDSAEICAGSTCPGDSKLSGKQGCSTCTTCDGSNNACQTVSNGLDPNGDCSQAYACSSSTVRTRVMCNGANACAAIDSAASDCSGTCASYCNAAAPNSCSSGPSGAVLDCGGAYTCSGQAVQQTLCNGASSCTAQTQTTCSGTCINYCNSGSSSCGNRAAGSANTAGGTCCDADSTCANAYFCIDGYSTDENAQNNPSNDANSQAGSVQMGASRVCEPAKTLNRGVEYYSGSGINLNTAYSRTQSYGPDIDWWSVGGDGPATAKVAYTTADTNLCFSYVYDPCSGSNGPITYKNGAGTSGSLGTMTQGYTVGSGCSWNAYWLAFGSGTYGSSTGNTVGKNVLGASNGFMSVSMYSANDYIRQWYFGWLRGPTGATSGGSDKYQCCKTSTDCVYNAAGQSAGVGSAYASCYADGTAMSVGGGAGNDYCGAGTWYDCGGTNKDGNQCTTDTNSDSDGGDVKTSKGSCSATKYYCTANPGSCTSAASSATDSCASTSTVNEYYLTDADGDGTSDTCSTHVLTCDAGTSCQGTDGACVGHTPSTGSVSPNSGTFYSDLNTGGETFTSTYSDPDGWTNIQYVHLLINGAGVDGCNGAFYGYYNQNNNHFYILSCDAGAWLDAGVSGSVTETCGTDGGVQYTCLEPGSTTSGSGNTMTVTWKVRFKTAFADNPAYVYHYIVDDEGNSPGWVNVGSPYISMIPCNSAIACNIQSGKYCDGAGTWVSGTGANVAVTGCNAYSCSGQTITQNACNGAGACQAGRLSITTCSGDCNSACSAGSSTCYDTANAADPLNICSAGYTCSGQTIIDGSVCGSGTTCGASGTTCSGNCNSACNPGSGTCYDTAGSADPLNLCADGICTTGLCDGTLTTCQNTAADTNDGCTGAYTCSTQTIMINTCNGAGNCADRTTGTTCSGNCNSACSAGSGTCYDTTSGADPLNLCSGAYTCSGQTIIDGTMCGSGTTCGSSGTTCSGDCNSACNPGSGTCYDTANAADPLNLCNGGYTCSGQTIIDGSVCGSTVACGATGSTCSNNCDSLCVTGTGTCYDTTNGADPYGLCTDSGWNGCSGTCTRSKTSTDFCGTSTACQTATQSVTDGSVCSGAGVIEIPYAGVKCDQTINCVSGACSAAMYYRGCTSGACTSPSETNKQSAGTWYTPNNVTISATAYQVGTSCTTSSSSYCSTTSYNGCSGTGTTYLCQKTADYYTCNTAGVCNVDSGANLVTNVANGYVCSSGSEISGSSAYYAFADSTYTSCSLATTPGSGFGLQQKSVYSCNGANAKGAATGTTTNSCGTGCCNPNSPNTCAPTTSTAYNLYDFGMGDNAATDYCLSAAAYDCNTASECLAGFACQNKTCIGLTPMVFKDINNNELVYFDNFGKILHKGNIVQNAVGTPATTDIVFSAAGVSGVAWITSTTGTLTLKGTLNQNQGALNPAANTLQFANKSTIIGYIDGSGNMYIRGSANKMS